MADRDDVIARIAPGISSIDPAEWDRVAGPHPFVSHAFADVDLGQVGLLKVGNPKGTMTH